MKNTEKEFVLNRGLYLGMFFSIFPIIDLLFGENMSSKTYYILFYGLWFFVTTYLIYFFGKENRANTDLFDFKSAFRIMFLVSAIGFSLLTVTRITLWNVFYSAKYIELNQARDTKLSSYALEYAKSSLDQAYKEGSLSDEEYEESITIVDNQVLQAQEMIKEKWDYIKENGISKTLFVGSLIYNIFFISILNAILALIIRRKQEIA